MASGAPVPFWKARPLAELNGADWESLCDGCARCCLHKLEDEEDGTVHYTDVACKLLDIESCRCRDYGQRRRRVPDCVVLTPESAAELQWLPTSCAYRVLAEGGELAAWHPLLSGDPESVHLSAVSIRDWAVSERDLSADVDLEDHLIELDPPPSNPGSG